MCFMEGQGVDGLVGDESSPKRNAFARVFENVSLSLSSLFSLSSPSLFCRVLSCLVVCVCVCCARVLACVCWRAAHSHSFLQESWSSTALSGTANDRRNREHVVLDLLSDFKMCKIQGFLLVNFWVQR